VVKCHPLSCYFWKPRRNHSENKSIINGRIKIGLDTNQKQCTVKMLFYVNNKTKRLKAYPKDMVEDFGDATSNGQRWVELQHVDGLQCRTDDESGQTC